MPEPITMFGFGSGLMGLTAFLSRKYFETTKEILDVLLGIVLLVLFGPVILISGILIKLGSKGPVFYSQVRLGKDGRPFKLYKIRTMFKDAERRIGAVWARKGDSRVVPIARWMRKSHIDELPQLVNVIKGEMSLVGPRPERPEILKKLQPRYPNVYKRLTVKPGITGLAQIRNGYDTHVDLFKEKLKADIEYIDTRSWSLEFAIMLRTFGKFYDKSAH